MSSIKQYMDFYGKSVHQTQFQMSKKTKKSNSNNRTTALKEEEEEEDIDLWLEEQCNTVKRELSSASPVRYKEKNGLRTDFSIHLNDETILCGFTIDVRMLNFVIFYEMEEFDHENEKYNFTNVKDCIGKIRQSREILTNRYNNAMLPIRNRIKNNFNQFYVLLCLCEIICLQLEQLEEQTFTIRERLTTHDGSLDIHGLHINAEKEPTISSPVHSIFIPALISALYYASGNKSERKSGSGMKTRIKTLYFVGFIKSIFEILYSEKDHCLVPTITNIDNIARSGNPAGVSLKTHKKPNHDTGLSILETITHPPPMEPFKLFEIRDSF